MYVLADELTPERDRDRVDHPAPQGLTFHNGKDLTADDVIFTFPTILNPKAPGRAAGAGARSTSAGLKKLDPLHVRIPCKTPFASLNEALAIPGYSAVIPRWATTRRPPVGTGPFKVQSFTPGTQSTFVRL